MYKQIEFTREEIYKLVWAKPVLAVARDIGISDVALSKACRKIGVPLPWRGYWAAIKSGRRTKVPPLPTASSGQSTAMQFSVLENPAAKIPRPAVVAVPPLEVPAVLLKPHRLVAELQKAAKGAEEHNGVLPLNYEKVLRVRTSDQHLPRALILMDTLIKEFEGRGYSVRIGDKYFETELVLKEGKVSFRLDERTTQTEPPPPPPKPARKGRHEPEYEPWRPRYILKGTGEFTLEFGKYRLGGCRRVWKDRAKCPLEAQLHEVMEALPSWEAVLKEARLEAEQREADAREAENRRLAAARAQEVSRQRRANLVKNLEAWERADRLRGFIAAVEAADGQSAETLAWLKWAREQVEALDPLLWDFSAVTNLKVTLSEYFRGPSPWEKTVPDWWSE